MGKTTEKFRIMVIADDDAFVHRLQCFEGILSQAEVGFCLVQSAATTGVIRSGIKVKLFEPVKDMPGYLRGLEAALEKADMIISLDPSRLCTFQAVRAGMKFQVPVYVLVDETIPYRFAEYRNIAAVRADILENATGFLPSSEAAGRMLLAEGVSEGRILPLPPTLSMPVTGTEAGLRKKFREYVGIGPEERVFLYLEDYHAGTHHEDILRAFRVLTNLHQESGMEMRLVFAGEGDQADRLKYLAVELGLGKNVVFIQQKVAPFLRDLLQATDYILNLRRQLRDEREVFPFYLLEAMARGVLPIVSGGTVAAEVCGDAGVVVEGDHFGHLAEILSGLLLQDGESDRRLRAGCRLQVEESYSLKHSAEILRRLIGSPLEESPHRVDVRHKEAVLQKIKLFRAEGRLDEALNDLEDLLDGAGSMEVELLSDLLKEKGDLLAIKGAFVPAMEAYEKCTKLNDANVGGWLGLGQISYLSHAPEEALHFYKKALARDHHNAQAYAGIGRVHGRVGLHDEAIYWFSQSLNYDPGCQDSIVALAQVCLETDFVEAASLNLQKILEQVGEHPSLLMALGQLYVKNGQVDLGQKLIRRVLQENAVGTEESERILPGELKESEPA